MEIWVKADHDGRDADLCTLITVALQNGGLISQNKRKSYADRVPGRVFDAIDALCTARLAAKGSDAAAPPHPDQAALGV